jgi:hypothetical protein
MAPSAHVTHSVPRCREVPTAPTARPIPSVPRCAGRLDLMAPTAPWCATHSVLTGRSWLDQLVLTARADRLALTGPRDQPQGLLVPTRHSRPRGRPCLQARSGRSATTGQLVPQDQTVLMVLLPTLGQQVPRGR